MRLKVLVSTLSLLVVVLNLSLYEYAVKESYQNGAKRKTKILQTQHIQKHKLSHKLCLNKKAC